MLNGEKTATHRENGSNPANGSTRSNERSTSPVLKERPKRKRQRKSRKPSAKRIDQLRGAKSGSDKILSADLPKKTLEDALKVARVIKDEYAGKLATWEDIARGMNFSPTNTNNRYFLWSAEAYGIVEKDANDQYHITETGRKILAPTYEGEDREGVVKAIAKPSILARFYSDYGNSLLPSGDIFRNVLEQKYGIPSKRIDETIILILQNARFAKLLEEQLDGKYRLRSGNEALVILQSRS